MVRQRHWLVTDDRGMVIRLIGLVKVESAGKRRLLYCCHRSNKREKMWSDGSNTRTFTYIHAQTGSIVSRMLCREKITYLDFKCVDDRRERTKKNCKFD